MLRGEVESPCGANHILSLGISIGKILHRPKFTLSKRQTDRQTITSSIPTRTMAGIKRRADSKHVAESHQHTKKQKTKPGSKPPKASSNARPRDTSSTEDDDDFAAASLDQTREVESVSSPSEEDQPAEKKHSAKKATFKGTSKPQDSEDNKFKRK